jgi:hypothetical protein
LAELLYVSVTESAELTIDIGLNQKLLSLLRYGCMLAKIPLAFLIYICCIT